MARKQLGNAPADSGDTATVAYVLANKGSGGGTGGGIPVYIQTSDPALSTSYLWYQVDTNGNLVSVWTNYQPAPTTLASESFTGTDGATWPTQWQIVTIGNASATIVSNRGRMVTNGGGYNNGVTAYLPNMAATLNTDTYLEMTFDGTVTEQYLRVCARVQSNDSSGNAPSTGYQLTIGESTGQVTVVVPGGTNGPTATVSSGGFVSSTWGVRFRLVGSTLTWRMWNLTGTEPTTWTQTVTDTTYAAAGRLMLSGQNGNDGAQRTFDVDNIVVNAAS